MARDLHPLWSFQLWSDSDIDQLNPPLINRRIYDRAKNFGMKSDIARYEILHRFGGVYVDLDIEFLRPLDYEDLHEHTIDWSTITFFAGFSNSQCMEINNSILGSVASHPLLLEMINQISLSQPQLLSRVASISTVSATVMSFLDPAEVAAMLRIQQEDQWMDTLKFTGSGLLTRSIHSFLKQGYGDGMHALPSSALDSFAPYRMRLLPMEVFSPVPNSVHVSVSLSDESIESREAAKRAFVKDGVTIAVHWWQRSWQV
eukprot:gene24599-33067_t